MPTAPNHFDLAVIGGGPAGTSAAIAAARAGADVVLYESHQFPRHKVCGEFVSAEALDVLSDLLAEQPLTPDARSRSAENSAGRSQLRTTQTLSDTVPIGSTRLWLGNRTLQASVSPPGLSISRYRLDATLWEAARAGGVDCRDNCEVLAVDDAGLFRLSTAAGTIVSRALIVAAGRWSQFTPDRTVPPGPKWIGLKAHFREPRPEPSTDLYFFANGYCGVQRASRAVINVCAMVRSDRASSLLEVFRLHPALAKRASRWTAVTPPISTAPLIYRQPRPVRENLAFVGDAAAFIDPFVGDGISLALRSGRAAAGALSSYLAGQCTLAESLAIYEAEYQRSFTPVLTAASRIRSLLSLPAPAQTAVFELLRLPGLMSLMIRKTRQAY